MLLHAAGAEEADEHESDGDEEQVGRLEVIAVRLGLIQQAELLCCLVPCSDVGRIGRSKVEV